MQLSAAVIERVFSNEPSSPPQAQSTSLSGDKCLLLRSLLSPDLEAVIISHGNITAFLLLFLSAVQGATVQPHCTWV